MEQLRSFRQNQKNMLDGEFMSPQCHIRMVEELDEVLEFREEAQVSERRD